jgi:hypothetical protein
MKRIQSHFTVLLVLILFGIIGYFVGVHLFE